MQFSYDSSQRVKSATNIYGVDELGGASSTYDALNRLISVTYPGGSSSSFQYGELGNVEKNITNFGTVTAVEYNKLSIQ